MSVCATVRGDGASGKQRDTLVLRSDAGGEQQLRAVQFIRITGHFLRVMPNEEPGADGI